MNELRLLMALLEQLDIRLVLVRYSRVSALGCREVGFYCDTWGKHYSQLIWPKIWINHANSAAFRLTAEGKELG
jgi:hypothetical protein